MKVIDLLNKIANNEEIPNKFKFAQQIFIKEGLRYIDEDGYDIFESIFNDFSNINDEIEIIEEDKPIKKIGDFKFSLYDEVINAKSLNDLCCDNFNKMYNKINELVDKVNELEKRGNKDV